MVFAHDSFLGFVNLLRIGNFKKAYHPGDRPPYPIIIDSPSVRDVVLNMNRADLGFFCFLGLIGIPVSRWVVNEPGLSETLRSSGFKLTMRFFIMMGISFAVYNSASRLTGMTYNGLKWRYNLEPIKKYDFTSEHEKGTLWQYFRNK